MSDNDKKQRLIAINVLKAADSSLEAFRLLTPDRDELAEARARVKIEIARLELELEKLERDSS
jgi:hypothetical protein